ncbi:MAG: hypothetical protein AAGI45_06785 [Cyanobacteria bacterium P01_H01_bin.26]
MSSWIFVLFIAIFVAAVAASFMLERRRTEAIKQLADTLGFDYCEHPQTHLPNTIWRFNLFNKGRGRRLKNLIQGSQDGVRVSIGEYKYTQGTQKNRHTHWQTVVFMESDRLNLPSFLLIPENLFHKIGTLFGCQDINFDAYPEFSSLYVLKGSDEEDIRQRFHDGVLHFYQNHPRMSTEGAGPMFIYYRSNRRMQLSSWQSLLNEAMEAYEQFSQQV